MKKVLFLVLSMAILSRSDAQLLKKIVDKTKQKTEHKISEKISEKASDAASKPIDEVGKSNKNKDNSSNGSNNKDNKSTSQQGGDAVDKSGSPSTSLATYSKYDFVPGEKILVMEDFSQDAVGDFPSKWNTNSTGEVVTASGQEGHWLMLNKKGKFIPEFINNLPDNFTLQFDLICNEKFNYYSNPLTLLLLTGGNGKQVLEYSFIPLDKRSGVKIGFHPNNAGSNGGTAYISTYEDGDQVINNEISTRQFDASRGNNKIKVSLWRQKQRIRVYFNQEKVFDLPKAFAAGKTYNAALFELWAGMHTAEDRYLINNITLAIGAPDTRNKLITEGKFVTHGILFDVNSDKIKPESYGVLKDISTVLSENPDVKVKIIGHTDADGKDADNLDLSKRRAEAVKSMLKSEFKIDESRLQTDGKGESQPVDKNDTPSGKANNRRVEFIKL
ncbi:MAG TPA: OmpA family protein [Chitinophagaceae bacterium]|nr:OmpA family protein [Chitinophagaceae bacterium]